MSLNEINFISILIWIVLFYFVVGFENSFKSIIVSEFIWITFFCFYLIISIVYDDINCLSLILFFLIFSAIEISICLIIILFQKKIIKSFFVNYDYINTQNKKIRFLGSFKFKN